MDAPPENAPPAPRRAPTLLQSFRFAGEGLWYALRSQRNLRIHFGVAVAVFSVAVGLDLTRVEWAVLVLLVGLVLAAELINTVVEAVVDLVSPEYHPLAKVAKDVAAAAVLIVSITSVAVGLLILGPPLWQMMR